jgi:lipopolysaccharide export system protein LptC
MKDRWLAFVPLLLMAGLAALTWWLDQVVEPLSGARDGNLRHDPDIIVESMSAVQMAETGTPRYSVIAKRLVHYPDDRTTQLEFPVLTHFDEAGAPVTIRSDRGELAAEGTDAYFRDNVLVRRPAYGDDEEMTLTTSYLHVIPDENLAKTDKPVTLTHGDSVVHGVGLEFNNETRNLKLLSHVRGTYQTPPKGKTLPWNRAKAPGQHPSAKAPPQ